MEKITNSPKSQRPDLICPITLDVYRDPVLAGDGHVYERVAIIRWIEQQGTSPLTREPLDVNDLCSEENIKQLCQSYQSNLVSQSCPASMISLPSSPVTQSNEGSERRTSCKQHCNAKRTFLIIAVSTLIFSPFIIATSIIFCLHRFNSISSTVSTSTRYSPAFTYSSTIHTFSNNCTLPQITPLFTWNNVEEFNYTYYSKLYKAVSTRTTITFAFRHGPSYWCLDDVSVIDTSSETELVINGNFENNPLDEFMHCNSYGNSSTTFLFTSSHPYHGKRSFCGGTVSPPNYLSQTLDTKIGQVYCVSFWLQNEGDAPNNAQVVMSY